MARLGRRAPSTYRRRDVVMLPPHLIDRVRRADSWIKAAARLELPHLHERFLFLYIAFNCLYGRRPYEGDASTTLEDLATFVRKVLALAQDDEVEGRQRLERAIAASRDDGAILIRDRYLDDRYWRRTLPIERLHATLTRDAAQALKAIEAGDYESYLVLVFGRIAVLRNQVMHGCSTYGPVSLGRSSLAKAVRFMAVMVPALHDLVRTCGSRVPWDPSPYPRLGSPHPH